MSGPAAGCRGGEEELPERRLMLLAFVELVSEQGFVAVDGEAVIRRAGTAPGSFERHFADRRECFVAAWDQLERVYMERLRAAYDEGEGWLEQFRLATAETVRLAEAHPVWARFLTVASLGAGEVGRERQRALGERLAALLDSAREQIEDPDAVPEVTARWVLGIFFDRFYRRFASPPGPDLAPQLPELRFLAVSSYFGPEAGLAELDIAP
jgi:AcrR family transcriptional regulator